MHGLKKSGMTEIVMAGASAPELMAVSGHRSMAEAQTYIEEAFQRPELAGTALAKVRTKRANNTQRAQTPIHKHPVKPLKKQEK
jgi:hypothetical protein